jgi:cell division protein FtsX
MAGVVTVLATVVAVNVASSPPPTPSAMALAIGPGCGQPEQAAVEVAVFLLEDVTDQQRADLDESLRSDPRIRQVRYDSREVAYERFKRMYQDEPDLVAAVKPGQLPASFRLTLAHGERRVALEEELRQRPGVETVVGTICGKLVGEGE